MRTQESALWVHGIDSQPQATPHEHLFCLGTHVVELGPSIADSLWRKTTHQDVHKRGQQPPWLHRGPWVFFPSPKDGKEDRLNNTTGWNFQQVSRLWTYWNKYDSQQAWEQSQHNFRTLKTIQVTHSDIFSPQGLLGQNQVVISVPWHRSDLAARSRTTCTPTPRSQKGEHNLSLICFFYFPTSFPIPPADLHWSAIPSPVQQIF